MKYKHIICITVLENDAVIQVQKPTEPRENIRRHLSLFEKIVQDFVFGCINLSRKFAIVSFVNGSK